MIVHKINNEGHPLHGRFVHSLGREAYIIATPTLPGTFFSAFTVSRLRDAGALEPVELREIKWIHPHLYLPIRAELEKEKRA